MNPTANQLQTPVPEALGKPGRNRYWIYILLTLVPVLLWPGDVSWLLDEPRLIASAWHANASHQLASGGLYGNFAVRYGPLPTQIYQLLLSLTHDPFVLVMLRGALCAGLTAVGLVWMAGSIRVPKWFAAALLIGPEVVHYQRVLWDASFTVPIGTLTLAAMADFLQTQRRSSLRMALAGAVCLPMIHPQALPLAFPVIAWLLWGHWRAVWADRKGLAVVALLLLVLHGRYLIEVFGQITARMQSSVAHGYPGGSSHLRSALAPFLGGNLLAGQSFPDAVVRPSLPIWLHVMAQTFAQLIYPLAWLGVGWSVMRVIRLRGGNRLQGADQLVVLLLLGLLFQAMLFGVLRIPTEPQYFFGTFALHALAVWLGIACLSEMGRYSRIGRWIGILCGLGLALLTCETAYSLHRYGYEKIGWPSLRGSVAVLEQASQCGRAVTDVPIYQKAPQILRTLGLLRDVGGVVTQAESTAWITHEQEAGRFDPSVRVLSGDVPAKVEVVDLSPLPKDWVPDPRTW